MIDHKEQWLTDILQLIDSDDEMTDKQAKIVEAAIEIFAVKGFAATSTSEIAQKAGVAEGTIFRHYKTKKDLLLSIAGPIAVKTIAPFLMNDFAKIIDMPYNKAEDFFKAIVRDRLKFVKKNEKLIRILIHELPFQTELLEQAKKLMSEIVLRRIEKVIRHFQGQGQIIEAPPWRIIRTVASVFMGMAAFHVLIAPDANFDEEEEIDRTVQLLLNGISGKNSVDSHVT